MNTPVILRPAEVGRRLGVSTSTLKRWARNNIGPERVKLGPRAVGYRADDVDSYLRSLGSA